MIAWTKHKADYNACTQNIMNHKADRNAYGNLYLGFALICCCFEPKSFEKEYLYTYMNYKNNYEDVILV